jgi:hypothetical protein
MTETDEAIPLPPPEIVEQMMGPSATTAPSPSAPPMSAAQLKFTGEKKWTVVVPLEFPFEHEGRLVEVVTVRRLTVAEMGALANARGDQVTLWDAYAAMTGLPEAVLRGMEAGDGAAVTDITYDFLPRQLRTA